ncbi:Regucalcin [Blattella germanica]|nr:Regucalcin [Blattella germanica]
MAAPKVEAVTKPLILGEGPHWDQDEKVLYFVDLPGSTVNKYDPVTKKHTSTSKIDGGNVTFVLPIKGKKDKFAIAIERDLAIMTWNGEDGPPQNIERLLTIENEPGKSGNRFNDAKCDPNGRLWAGTMGPELGPGEIPPHAGAFYSISKNLEVKTHITEVGISNGLAWSKDLEYFYYVDSHITKVFRYKFNSTTGEIYPETGNLLQSVCIPAPNVTSVAFGGSNLDELYVTTASIRMTPEQEKKYPTAGAVFKVTGLGVKGYPGVSVDLN